MELIIGFILIVLGTLGTALSRQLTDECKAWTPWLTKYLINRATRKLREEERDRFEEEWLPISMNCPGRSANHCCVRFSLRCPKDIVRH